MMKNLTDTQAKQVTEILKSAIGAYFDWQELRTEVKRTRDGWAAYKGAMRITRHFFSEEGAREAGVAWEAADIKVQF